MYMGPTRTRVVSRCIPLITDSNQISLSVGANLNKGFYTNYQRGFNVVNVNVKYSTSFKIASFKLPVSASYVLNPYKNKSYFTMSLYFGL